MSKPRPKIDPTEIAKTKRPPVTLAQFEGMFGQIMAHRAKPEKGSENREPTKGELSEKWQLRRKP